MTTLKKEMNLKQRAEMVRSMEVIARSLNDEETFEVWQQYGVADGDITPDTKDEDLMCYCEDERFADLMALFMRVMRYALEDEEADEEDIEAGNYILCCDDILGKEK